MQRYAAFLDGMLTVVAPLETQLGDWLGDSDGPSRTRRLQDDLGRLGMPRAARKADIRLPATLAEAYGCSYVLEGSTLGGMALAPVIERSLGGHVPTTYLRLRGADTGRAWRAFLQRLDAFDARCAAHERREACDMAVAVFVAATDALVRAGATVRECATCNP